jgi:hypothetical protein
MQQIVINRCHGGFRLSKEAVKWLREHDYEAGERCKLSGEEYEDRSGTVSEIVTVAMPREDEFRAAPGLAEVVKELGDDANGRHAELKVVGVPDGVEWTIKEYDGAEWVAEKHRTWR